MNYFKNRILIFIWTMVSIVLNISSNEWYNTYNFQENKQLPQVTYDIVSKEKLKFTYFLNELEKFWGSESKVNEYFDYKSFRNMDLIYKKDLNPIRDKHLYSGITFLTQKKSTVYMSLTKSENCPDGSSCKLIDKFFIVFISNDKTQFVRVKDVINLSIFISGSKTIEFDGEKYVVKIKANMSDVYLSRVEVADQYGNKVINKTLAEIRDLVSLVGYELKIEKSYRVVYGRKFECQSKELCEFKNSNVVFIFEYPVSENSDFFSIDESIWRGKDLFFENIGKKYFFNVADGILVVKKQL